MDTEHHISWNSTFEDLLKDEGEKCLSMMWLHHKAERKYTFLNHFIALPVMLLSTLSGAGSIGSQSMFGDIAEASIIIGFVSISVGFLQLINNYFAWLRRAEGHKIAMITYERLYNFIRVELALPRLERMAAKDILKVVREQMERLNEVAPQIPNDVIREYQAKFDKYDNVKKPEITNGLEEIVIYREEEHTNSPSVRLPTAPPQSKVGVRIVTEV